MTNGGPGIRDLVGMGVTTAACLVVGFGLGYLLDSLAGTSPAFVLVGLLLGIIGAVAYTIAQFRKYL